MNLPHDRSNFFSTQRYWDAVSTFFYNELKNDGEDITSQCIFVENKQSSAHIISKQSGIFCGKQEASFLLDNFFPNITYKIYLEDNNHFEKNNIIMLLSGPIEDMLKAERLLVNVFSRMSGVATQTSQYVSTCSTAIAATRKTQWGYLDKKAVFSAGGLTHRMGLFDAILIKENHSIAFGDGKKDSITVLSYAEKNIPPSTSFLEIEVETPEEFILVYNFLKNSSITIPKVIMFDNFSCEDIQKTLEKIDAKSIRQQYGIFLEISGGINASNIALYDTLGADVISVGALTHSVLPIDFSMRIKEQL